MDEEIERLVVSVRADTGAFAQDVAAMRGNLEGPLAAGADRAGRAIEATLLRAVRTGSLGFEDLRKVAMAVLSDIAAAAIRAGIESIAGGGKGGGSDGLAALIGSLLGGRPGRATGGPVSPGAAYVVGERGPELFVPTSAGRVEVGGTAAGPREVRVAITINAAGGAAPGVLAQSSRQVARAVKAALAGVD
ncbi:tail tape measure protein [Sphingomonas donggukensis]|uniref:Tail tape measure protein n=1 Tax=Sphingomonas donggukensis TaxID=2949093 RepID=A0ABY4TWB8_9SPHN|nr:tail tape measure protein [Sphingomonas donggukensis]URW75454.1 tail tape measure protein [Sphingomonas donggukensis]